MNNRLFPGLSNVAKGVAGLAMLSLAWMAQAQHPLPVEQALKVSVGQVSGDLIELRFVAANGTYFYRDKFALSSATPGVSLGAVEFPRGQRKTDAFFGDVEILRGDVRIALPVHGAKGAVEISVVSQGCADIGICYPPQKNTFNVALGRAAIDKGNYPISGLQGSLPAALQASASPSAPFAKETVRTVKELNAALKRARGGWVMVDYWAEWCLPCKHMERTTFADARVRAQLASYTVIKVDVTQSGADSSALLKRYGLVGPPGLLFIEPKGKEVKGSRILGIKDADGFLAHLKLVASTHP